MKKEFYNLKYGKCKLLDKKKDLYLVYAENWNYIILFVPILIIWEL